VAGRRVDSDLPKGDSTLTRWLNEVQMFLHCHPINQSRQGEGKPAVNSMWLWGGGKLSTTLPSASFSGVWTDNPLAIGLGNLHYTITAGERWKFWKRSENIVTTAEQLAENANP
jgi:hypothetical protein